MIRLRKKLKCDVTGYTIKLASSAERYTNNV